MRGVRVDIGGLATTAEGGGEGEGEKGEDFILCCSFLHPTGGITRPPILLLRRGGHMIVGGSVKGNDGDDGSRFREKCQDEGGRGRTGKDADIEDVDVELDG